MNADDGVTDRDKLSGLFLFAQGVLAARGRVLMRMQDTELGYFPEVDVRDLPGLKFESDDETWMRLDRLRETAPPAPNEMLAEWVEGRFDDPLKKPSFKPVIVREADIEEISDLCEAELLDMEDVHPIDEEETESSRQKIALRLENLTELRTALEQWRDGAWEEWAREERPIRKSINLYNRLFKLHNMMHGGVAETPPELVWGIGIARWKFGSGQIDMPLIEQFVDLEVQKGGALCIRPRDVRPSFSLKPFLEANIEGASEAQRYLQERFALIAGSEDAKITPFDTTAWENLLDAAATRLSSRAKHVTRESIRDGAEIAGPTGDLTIYSSWAIYGRPRSENLREQDLERLRTKIEDAQNDDFLPKSMRGFVAPKPEGEINDEDDWGLTRTNLGGSGESSWGSTPIKPQGTVQSGGHGSSRSRSGNTDGIENTKVYFFPLSYNDEQSQIIDRLETEDVVTVTGPPGTGKTHTIANIISHFMATGRRVLVTARTAEAIAAIREKLPTDLASLVIASVASDREGAKLLEEAIQKLSDDVVSLNVDRTKEEIDRIEEDIVRIDHDMRECNRNLSDIATTNLAPLTWHGEERTAMQLAGILAEIESEHDWMTDRPSLAPPATLEATLERLREALPKIGGDVVYISAELPDPAELPTAAELIEVHQKELAYRNRPVEDFSNQPVMARDDAAAEDVATDLHSVIDAARIALKEAPGWQRTLVTATIRARIADEPTPKAFGNISKAVRLVENRQAGKITYDLGGAERKKLIEAVARAQDGSRPVPMGASIFYRNLVIAIESVRLNESIPKEPEEWKRVYDAMKVEDQRPEIEDIWKEDASAGRLPDLPSSADDVVAAVRDAASRVPEIKEVVETLLSEAERLKRLFPYGLDVDGCLGDLNLDRLLKALRANMKDSYVPPSALAQLKDAAQGGTQPIFENFGVLRSLLGKDGVGENEIVEARSAITTEILRIKDLQEALSAIDRDLKALREAGAPDWADACLADPVEVDRIISSNWRPAWDWAVMRGRIDRIIALGNGNEWREKKADLRKSREQQFERLIRARTLLGLKRRLTGPVQTALLTFTTAIRRLGRGTGKSAVRWRKAIRAAAMHAAPAAPVWIMPEYKIAEQLPAELEDFDLVILDEASQSDITAIGALARGKKHLIVGDEKQVSPSAVGIPQNKIDVLRAVHLAFLPNKNVIDENTSIFEIAMQMYPKTHLILREHFRCAEPIIQFSTRFYNGRLVPLRVPKASERFDPPLVDVFVKGGERRGMTNQAEARFIVDEIAEIARDPNHAHRDAAVISLIGDKQAELIERMLIEDPRVGTEAMERLRIVCGDSRTMQGQERSIVFLSMVATPGTSRVQNSQGDAQRFNVALSRARDRLYLVRSVSTYDLRPGDLKRAALEHFTNPMPEGRTISGQGVLDRCQSGFEREVCARLLDANYRVRSQVQVGPYSIDLVVEGADDRRLAIELDGDFWHGPEKWEQDMARQAALERAGWTFWRVFGSQWMSEKDYWWRNLTNTMSTMGIEPIGAEASEDIFTEFRIFDTSLGPEGNFAPEEGTLAPDGASQSPPDAGGDIRPSDSNGGVDTLDVPSDLDNEGGFNALASSQTIETRHVQNTPRKYSDDANPSRNYIRKDEAKPVEKGEDPVTNIAMRTDAKRFYDDGYQDILLSVGCTIVDKAGPITFKHLCDRIARLHGFQRTGPEIKRTIWRVMHRARGQSRDPDNATVFWPKGADGTVWIPFRGMEVDGVVRTWSDLPFPEKLGLAHEILSRNEPDPALEMSRQLGLSRLHAVTRQQIEAVVAAAQALCKSE